MNIAAFCIRHKVTTILAFVILSIFGFQMYSDLKLTLIPEVTYPGAFVSCYYHGASPEDMEELITRPLESAIATVSGVKTIQSNSSENMSQIMITYTEDTDLDMASVRVREKLDRLSLPEGADKPLVQNLNMNEMMPILNLTLTGDDLSELQGLCDEQVKPALERIEGVARVDVYGGMEETITIATDTARLSGYQLSISQLSQYLQAANVLQPAGDVQNGTHSLTVTTDGQLRSLEELSNLLIPLSSGGFVRLSEVANVYIDRAVQDTIAKANGTPCVVLAIIKQSDANEVATAKKVQETLKELQADVPQLEYLVVMDTSEYILSASSTAITNIIAGVVLAVVVVFVFLRRLGATLTIGVSLPFCILTVFVVMKWFDVTLNTISLGGIALGVGMIVDNSIVVLENIYRYAAQGYERFDACVKATQEVSLPIIASTLTTIAVFLPIGLSGGLAGMMFKDFALTIAFLLLSSLLIAMTLVPLLCYFLLDETRIARHKRKHDETAPPLAGLLANMRRQYLAMLGFFIRKRWVAVLISMGMMGLFITSTLSVHSVLMPDVDQGEISISISTPTGTDLEETAQITDGIVRRVEANCPSLESLYYYTQSTSATLSLNLVGRDERNASSKEIAAQMRQLLADVPGCEITISTSSMSAMASSGKDIDIKITGAEREELERIARELSAQIDTLSGAVNVKSSVSDASPAVKVTLLRDNAAQYGLTAASIGQAVRAELKGATATSMTLNGKEMDVVIQGNETAKASLDALRSLPITTATGGQIPLSAVANVQVELSPQTISRYNQSRQVSITGDIEAITLSEMTQAIQTTLDNYPLPEGYTAEVGGSFEDMSESFSDLLLALTIALGLVYFVLASQFESFLMPLIVMLILPLALTGALFGLPVTGSDLSMIVMVGLIMLSGVVVNASIILVDYIKVRRLLGEEKNQAILEACPLRIRPIMMTTLTTVLAMLPMALGYGEGAELMQPMSIVMMSGMIIATVITLFFTPVYYSLLDSFNERLGRIFFRKQYKARLASTQTETESTKSEE